MTGPSTSSGLKAASAAILAAPGRLRGITLIGGSDASTAIVYDNASAASGTVLEKIAVAAGATVRIDYQDGVVANAGIYLALTGTAVGAVVHYDRG